MGQFAKPGAFAAPGIGCVHRRGRAIGGTVGPAIRAVLLGGQSSVRGLGEWASIMGAEASWQYLQSQDHRQEAKHVGMRSFYLARGAGGHMP